MQEGICPERSKEEDMLVNLKNHAYCDIEGCESAWFGEGCSKKDTCTEYKRLKEEI